MRTSVSDSVACSKRQLLSCFIGLVLVMIFSGCTGEYSLDGLEQRFPDRQQQLNALRTLIGEAYAAAGVRSYHRGPSGEEIIEVDKDRRMSLQEAIRGFSKISAQLNRIGQLGRAMNLMEVSFEMKAVVVTMGSGGALASSSGYLYDESKQYLATVQKFRKLQGEQHWYVFIDS